ncbi:MAG: molybdopterin-dependent oxidoreductase [Chloroflexota bacterium]
MDQPTSSNLFRQHKRHVPKLVQREWTLIVDGFCDQALTLNYTMLSDFEATVLTDFFICIDHGVDIPRADVVQWRGISWQTIEPLVRPASTVTHANIHSADGYAVAIPLNQLREGIIATHLNNKALPDVHGGPARLVFGGVYGQYQPKWIQHIILTDSPISDDPVLSALPTAIALESRQLVRFGEAIHIEGKTNAPKVEISIDGGPWNPTTVRDMVWFTDWTPPSAGHYRLVVRAANIDGYQPEATQPVIQVEVLA